MRQTSELRLVVVVVLYPRPLFSPSPRPRPSSVVCICTYYYPVPLYVTIIVVRDLQSPTQGYFTLSHPCPSPRPYTSSYLPSNIPKSYTFTRVTNSFIHSTNLKFHNVTQILAYYISLLTNNPGYQHNYNFIIKKSSISHEN